MLERDQLVDMNQDLERHRDLLNKERQRLAVDYEEQRRRGHSELIITLNLFRFNYDDN